MKHERHKVFELYSYLLDVLKLTFILMTNHRVFTQHPSRFRMYMEYFNSRSNMRDLDILVSLLQSRFKLTPFKLAGYFDWFSFIAHGTNLLILSFYIADSSAAIQTQWVWEVHTCCLPVLYSIFLNCESTRYFSVFYRLSTGKFSFVFYMKIMKQYYTISGY